MENYPIVELYFYESCPYCQRVLRVVEALDLKISYRDIRKNLEYREKLIDDTGRATVPCLYVDGVPMHESDDIMDWLRENADKLAKEH